MKIEIVSEKENQLLERKEVRFNVLFEGGAPNIKDVRKELTGKLNSKDNLTVVDTLRPNFGERRLAGYAKVYKNEKGLNIELPQKMSKNFGKKEEKAKDAPAAPAEKKEEKK